MRQLTRIFDLKKWTEGTLKTFYGERRKLELAAATARHKKQREKARFELARFFFANRFAAEAVGVLRAMSNERPGVRKLPEFRALRGAANSIIGYAATATARRRHGSRGTGP